MNYYKSKADKALKQIEEAYEAVVGVPPGKAAHKQLKSKRQPDPSTPTLVRIASSDKRNHMKN